VPDQSKFGGAADKLLGSEPQSCGQESAIGNDRERRLRNSGTKKDPSKKKRKGDDKKGNNPDEEDDTFDKV
jgi:hypothetical protein